MTTDSESLLPVLLRTGQDEAAQISSFQNATFQLAGPLIALSIATSVNVPEEIINRGEAAVAEWVAAVLAAAANAVARNALSFEVHVGSSDAGTPL